MNRNSIVIRISKRDYCMLPEHCRMLDDTGPWVLTKIAGQATFAPAYILE